MPTTESSRMFRAAEGRRVEPVRRLRSRAREPRARDDYRGRYAPAPAASPWPLVLAGGAFLVALAAAAFIVLKSTNAPAAPQQPMAPAAPVAAAPAPQAAPAVPAVTPAAPAPLATPAPQPAPAVVQPAPAVTRREPSLHARLFPSFGLSHVSQFETGAQGHLLQAQDVWRMRVQALDQGPKQYTLTLAVDEVLKGEAQPKDRTLILGCADPKREFGLTLGRTEGDRFVVFLTADNRFFMLTADDYAKVSGSAAPAEVEPSAEAPPAPVADPIDGPAAETAAPAVPEAAAAPEVNEPAAAGNQQR
ncbi:MAG: hypothetical protein AMXMBFR7_29680 [Planctomycetota bacterium]